MLKMLVIVGILVDAVGDKVNIGVVYGFIGFCVCGSCIFDGLAVAVAIGDEVKL
jgi:hypothetical protein